MRNTWDLYILESGNTWTFSEEIYVPNNDEGLNLDEACTIQEIQLVDASQALVTPETITIKQPLNFVWVEIERDFVDTIRAYFITGEIIKLTTDFSGVELIGYFSQFTPKLKNGEEQMYDLTVTFKQVVVD